jgi:hypothetical protein
MTKAVNKYKIICATPHGEQEFKEKSQLYPFLEKEKNIKYTIIYQNKVGLPKIYNTFISEDNRNERLIFVHHDVSIEDIFLCEKLDSAFLKYDIVGLAGSKSCNINSEMAAWHLMSSKEHMAGEVAHSKDEHVWTTCFGPTDTRVLVLDGLFIAVNTSKLLDTNTKFDERFDFHHYDITFCLNANKNKLKMGVYPIRVTHFGLGDSMLTDGWRKSNELFKKLYVNSK